MIVINLETLPEHHLIFFCKQDDEQQHPAQLTAEVPRSLRLLTAKGQGGFAASSFTILYSRNTQVRSNDNVIKGYWWMVQLSETMKDVPSCENPGEAAPKR